jgi:hypothetical protein
VSGPRAQSPDSGPLAIRIHCGGIPSDLGMLLGQPNGGLEGGAALA